MLEIGQWIATTVLGNDAGQGNPMVVARLADWLPEATLHALSCQLPAHEVTFVVTNGDMPTLRWFGPHGEVPFCGHGALAAAALLTNHNGAHSITVLGGTGKLPLLLGHDQGFPMMQMPAMDIVELEPDRIDLGLPVVRLFDAGRDYLAILPDEALLRSLQPPREHMLGLDKIGVILTAQTSLNSAVFRFFAPRAGIEEDSVSCSVLPALAALWFGDNLAQGTFVQCSGIDISMAVQRCANAWRVAGPVYLTGQGTLDEVNLHSIQEFKRSVEC